MLRLLFLLLLLVGCSPDPAPTGSTQITALLGDEAAEGFLRAYEPRSFVFPGDHGVHPGFRSEWWYITGNLDSAEGRRFGFQVTFFRFALSPPAAGNRASRWAFDHMWMAHVAVTDPRGNRHHAEERLAREALGLAGAEQNPFKVWLEGWSLTGTDNGFPWHLTLDGEEVGLQLSFSPLRAPVLQGREGLSQKGDEPGNASYYYSITRMQTRGVLTLGERRFEVGGLSWLDREWGTSALGGDQVGWDWFSLQLNDGTDLMYYRLRRRSGEPDPHSAGTLLFKNGEKRLLGPGDVRLEPEKWWTSPDDVRYPVSWQLTVRPLARTFLVTGVIDAQEMDLSVVYWEGAVDVFSAGKVVGRGYLEMTGY
jgi:predicted secreted hydrolase